MTCDGNPGCTIKQVDSAALTDGAFEYLPNVILLNAGTNDCNLPNQGTKGGPARYATIMKNIREHNPDATVIASSLLSNLNSTVDECGRTLSAGIKEAVDNAMADGMKTGWVDIYNGVGKDYISSDKTHPTDEGYKRMAAAWFAGMKDVASKITAPDTDGKEVPATTACGGESGVKCRSQ